MAKIGKRNKHSRPPQPPNLDVLAEGVDAVGQAHGGDRVRDQHRAPGMAAASELQLASAHGGQKHRQKQQRKQRAQVNVTHKKCEREKTRGLVGPGEPLQLQGTHTC